MWPMIARCSGMHHLVPVFWRPEPHRPPSFLPSVGGTAEVPQAQFGGPPRLIARLQLEGFAVILYRIVPPAERLHDGRAGKIGVRTFRSERNGPIGIGTSCGELAQLLPHHGASLIGQRVLRVDLDGGAEIRQRPVELALLLPSLATLG